MSRRIKIHIGPCWKAGHSTKEMLFNRESENGWGRKRPLKVILPKPPFAEGCLDSIWVSPRMKTTQPPGQPVPVLGHPPSQKVFLMLGWNFPRFCLRPLPLVPSLEHHWKEPVSVAFIPSLQVFACIDEFPLSILFSRLNRPSSFSLSSHKRWSRPLIIFIVLHWTLSSTSTSLLYSGALNRALHPRCDLSSAE